jgi:uncharacterized SAM-dependent methyltransferase
MGKSGGAVQMIFPKLQSKEDELLEAFISFLRGDPSAAIYPFTYADDAPRTSESSMGQWDYALDTVDRTCKYYIFPNEVDLISRIAPDIAACVSPDQNLIELGIGSPRSVMAKTLPLLQALKPRRFIANDLSPSALLDAKVVIGQSFPFMGVLTCQSNFLDADTPLLSHAGANVVITGSTISNISHYDGHVPVNEVVRYLRAIGRLLGDSGSLIITQDTNQDGASVAAAYSSPSMVSFTREILYRMQVHPAVQGFDPGALVYDPLWLKESGLLAETFLNTRAQNVRVGSRAVHVPFGARLHVTNCYKYTVPDFLHMAHIAGLAPVKTWMDVEGRVALHVLRRR